jgi:hypothetical protein
VAENDARDAQRASAQRVSPRTLERTMSDTVPLQSRTEEGGYLLGAALIATLAALFATGWLVGVPSGPQPIGLGPVLLGFGYLVLGITFWASYLVPHKSFLFRGLRKFSMGFPGLPEPKMTLFMAFMCFLVGGFVLVEGLGFQLR